jgi:tetratricopeptide (TPR) repeat protein
MRCRRLPTLLTSLVLAFAASPARADDPHAAAYYRAFYLETGLRNFAQAEQAYRSAEDAARAANENNYLAAALVGRARCLIALGRSDEARAAADAARAADASNTEALRLFTADPTDGVDPELKIRLTALVQKLGEAEREQAYNDLVKVGDVKLSFLADGLRSRDVAVVESCAKLLGQHGTAAACAILTAAFGDAKVLFPQALNAAFSTLNYVPQAIDVVDAAMRSPDRDTRATACGAARNFAHPSNNADRARLVAVFKQALTDDDIEVAQQLASFAYCGREIVAEIVPELLAWLPRQNKWQLAQALKSIADIVPVLPDLEAFAEKSLVHPEPDVRKAAVDWLERRISNREIDAATAVRIVLDSSKKPNGDQGDLANALTRLEPQAIRSSHDVLIARCIELIDKASSEGEVVAVDRMLRMLTKAGAVTEKDLETLFATLDRQWTRLGSEHSATLLSVLLSATRNAILPDLESTKFELRQLATVENPEFASAWVERLLPSAGGVSGEKVAAILEIESTAVRAHFYKRYMALSGGTTYESQNLDTVMGSLPLSERALEHLVIDLQSPDALTRDCAYRFARKHPGPRFAKIAKQRLADADENSRPVALWYYAQCAGDAALPEIDAALKATDDKSLFETATFCVVAFAHKTLVPKVVGAAGTVPGRIDYVVEQIVGSGGSSPERRRELAQVAIESMTSEQFTSNSIGQLASLFDQPFPPLVERGLSATNSQARSQACRIAGTWCLESAEARLLEILETDTPDVAKAAHGALAAMRSRRELTVSTRLALGFDRSKSIADARAMLDDKDAIKRRGGALALGALGDIASVPRLLKLLDDTDPDVREAALTALGKLEQSSGAANPKSSDG